MDDLLSVDLSYCANPHDAINSLGGVKNTQSVAQLLAGFFTYYGFRFNYALQVNNVSNHTCLTIDFIFGVFQTSNHA